MLRIIIYTALLFMADGSVQSHDAGNNTVNLLGRFPFGWFDVFNRIDLRDHISRHPSKDRVAAVDDLPLQTPGTSLSLLMIAFAARLTAPASMILVMIDFVNSSD